MNKLLYIFLSLLVTFKSFPKEGFYIYILNKSSDKKNSSSSCVNKTEIDKKDNMHYFIPVYLEKGELMNIKKNSSNIELKVHLRNFVKKNITKFNLERIKKIFKYNEVNENFLKRVFEEFNIDIKACRGEIISYTITEVQEFLKIFLDKNFAKTYEYCKIYFSPMNANQLTRLIEDNNKILGFNEVGEKQKDIDEEEENNNKINEATQKKDEILVKIKDICIVYLEDIKNLQMKENYSINVYDELTTEINDFFLSNSYDQSNLTGMFSVNESLNNEIECIKSDYVKKCNEEIKIKLNEFNKMKAENEKTKKDESKTVSTTATTDYKSATGTKTTGTKTTGTTGYKTATATTVTKTTTGTTGTKTTSPITTTGAKTTTSTGVDTTDHVQGNKSGKTNTSNGCCISCRKNIN